MDKILNNLASEYPSLRKNVSKGMILFHENDECNRVGIVLKGELKIVSTTYYGDEILYRDCTEGMMFGNNLIFSETPLYRGDIIAVCDSEVLLLSRKQLMESLSADPKFLELFLKEQSKEIRSQNTKIKILSLSDPTERLMFYLSANGGKTKIRSVTELAQNLSLTRESVSRVIHKLVREKKISYSDHVLMIC